MLPCFRSCIGKNLKALPAACSDTLPTEPLLFLYPRWFQAAILHTRQVENPRCRRIHTTRRRHGFVVVAGVEDSALTHPANKDSESQPAPQHDQTFRTRARQNGPKPSHALPSVSRDHDSWFEDQVEVGPWRPIVPKDKHYTSRHSGESGKPHKRSNSEKISELMLATALSNIPPAAPKEYETIATDAAFLEWLTGTSGENIWKHHDGAGCVLHVIPKHRSRNSRIKVVLTGSQRAREITQRYLKDMFEEYSTLKAQGLLDTGRSGQKSKSTDVFRVDELPRPREWSLKTFSQYVEAIVSANNFRAIERVLYPGEQSFNTCAAKVLMELFSDDTLRPFQSSVALRHALNFCSTRTDISHAARTIWEAARASGIVPDINCFDLEISRILRLGLSGRIHILNLLKEMEDTDIRPRASTWACIFQSLRTRKQQYAFLKVPTMVDLLRQQATRDIVLQALVKTTFEPDDQDPKCVIRLEEAMQKSFSFKWLTPLVVQSMIDRCVEVGAVGTVSRVLRYASDFNVMLDVNCFNSLLKAVVKTGNINDILVLLNLQPAYLDRKIQREQIDLMFELALNQDLINVCRVLWTYAVGAGSISFGMQFRLAKCLTRDGRATLQSQNRMIAAKAALIVGTDRLDLDRVTTTAVDQSGKDVIDILESLTNPVYDDKMRTTQLCIARSLIENEMRAWQRFKPMGYDHLLTLLNQAYKLDMEWKEGDIVSHQSLTQLLSKAIRVELLPVSSAAKTSEKTVPTRDNPISTMEAIFDKHSKTTDTGVLKQLQSPSSNHSPPTTVARLNASILSFAGLKNGCLITDPLSTTGNLTLHLANASLVDICLQYLGLVGRDV